MEKLAGENGYHHLVKVIFDEEQRAYFTIETEKSRSKFLSKEQSEAYKEMAKKDDTIYYREIDKEAFLYLNFRKYPKTHRRRDNKGISSRTSGKEGAGGSVKTAGASRGREAISGKGRARICRERKGIK